MNVEQIKEYEFEVEGKTDIYTVIHRKDKTWFCTCKAFQYQTNGCKHIEVVKQWQEAQRNTKHLVELTIEELNIIRHKLNLIIPQINEYYDKKYYENNTKERELMKKIDAIINGGK